MNQKYCILVVEDDRSWRLYYREILEDAGYIVELAASKNEAAHKLSQRAFDTAIVDLRLVDTDPKNLEGVEVIRLLRNLNPATRVIARSAFLTDDIKKQLDELGVRAILGKDGKREEKEELMALLSAGTAQ